MLAARPPARPPAATVVQVDSPRTVRVAVIGAVAAGALVLGLALALRPDAADGAQRLVQAADRFAPPAGWELVEATERGAGQVCVDVACPSAVRRYSTAGPVTAGQVRAAMTQAGWAQVIVDGDCAPQDGRTGAFPLCRAEATASGARVELVVAGPQPAPARFDVTLTLSG